MDHATTTLETEAPRPSRRDFARLALAATGVVYGDIGTSPLYAMRECFNGSHAVAPTPENVLGILSLVFWALTLVVVVKYLSYVLRADNDGEGGTLALLALAVPQTIGLDAPRRTWALVVIGLFGASLLSGEGIITPAISVLSAVEGLEVATPVFRPVVVPLTCAILLGLFIVQKHGTARVGSMFGPLALLWFASIAAIGLPWIVRHPAVLAAVNPIHGARFFAEHGGHGFLVLGAVVLCITGCEALYADIGHFGRNAIRAAWYAVVFPALLINYFGQGALLIERGAEAAQNPFYSLVSGWLLYPLVAISTIATVIASQALISGTFSLARQAVQLGYSPRLDIKHTSGSAEGQIYVREINNGLMVACIALVLAFRDSSQLAAAYGIAVTGTMTITSILFFVVMRRRWGALRAGALAAGFLLLDLSFFGANAAKIAHGAWVPVVMAISIFTVMWTWKRGRLSLAQRITAASLPIDLFLQDVELSRPVRVKGTAVFMTSNPDGAPPVLLHHFKHNKVLHEQVVLVSVISDRVPQVRFRDRVQVKELGHGFFRVVARYGFMQTPNVRDVLRRCAALGLRTVDDDTSYYLGRETLIATGTSGMSRWRKSLFAFLSRNARPATSFFGLPPNRVVELGTQIEI